MSVIFSRKKSSTKTPMKASTRTRTPRVPSAQESLTFRRSRTLTGSASEEVRTVSETKAQLRSPRLKEHELRSHRRTLGGYLVGVVIVMIGITLLLSQFLGVITVRVASSSPLVTTPDSPRYLQLIDQYFTAHPTERFRFALNQATLDAYFRAKAPEVATINFDNTTLATANADITFRVPVVAWQLQTRRYYVDSSGYSYTQNYYNQPSVTVKDDSGIDPATGAIVSDRFLQFMGRVIALTNQSGVVKITGVTIPRNTSREIDFSLEGRGYIVRTQLGRDPAAQTADIINAITYIDARGIKPRYIDVRISSRAIYQ